MAVKKVLDDAEGSLKLAEVVIKVLDAGGSVFLSKKLPDGSVELKELQINLWHDFLPQDLIDRATKIYPAVKYLFPFFTVDEWISKFKYDMSPDKEIAKWERWATKFLAKQKAKGCRQKPNKRFGVRSLARIRKMIRYNLVAVAQSHSVNG